MASAAASASSPSATGNAVTSTVEPRRAEIQRFSEQPRLAVHVRRVEDLRRQLGGVEQAADELEAPRAVAEVQMQDAGFAAHHPADVGVGGEPRRARRTSACDER